MYLRILLTAALLGLASCNQPTDAAVQGNAPATASVATSASDQPQPMPVIYIPVKAPSEAEAKTPS
ncbi:hypothetical protein HQ945_12960 [Phyllobacterium sp. BT25]|jgi:hypothetical protein|uniref:Lipoprotein n=1 Tax=Phyllobacterium pellucidum TaxID=2740464 RepID=A0A849VQ96_9HYPH|nr:hypothetical protein [Phyllobacterium pellucidum]NTS32168.1 hypothetical protein [Phyllobacterium pellucidum]